MKSIGSLLAIMALVAFTWSGLHAQNDKKDPEKSDSKEEKKTEPKREKLVYGQKFYTKILSIKGDSGRELKIETMVIDEKKMQEKNNWATQRQQQLTQRYSQIMTVRDPKSRAQQLQQWNIDTANFQTELAKKNVYSSKPTDVIATETARVRMLNLPVEFDDLGNQKKFTKKEIEERRDKTGLPGFPAEFSDLKQGQIVEIYMAKVPPTAKGKQKDDDDPPPAKTPEFVLIVISQEAK